MTGIRSVPVHYKPGGTWGICTYCGFKYRLSELTKNWQGIMVCKDDLDPKPDTMQAPRIYPEGVPRRDMSPEPADTFVGTVTPADL